VVFGSACSAKSTTQEKTVNLLIALSICVIPGVLVGVITARMGIDGTSWKFWAIAIPVSALTASVVAFLV
jgi:hypothetical protein